MITGISAIAMTFFLYLIDTDPPYADFGKTLLEFSINCTIVFLLLTLTYTVLRVLVIRLRAK